MEHRRRQRLVSGLTLIGLGIALYILQRTEGLGAAAVFFVIGGVFLAAYLARKEYGFLVPAGVLLGLGAAAAFQDTLFRYGNPALLGLGCGFLGIFVVALAYERRSHWWPLIPGVSLILLGFPDTERVFEWLVDNWPLVLVLIGVLMLFGAFRRPRGGEA